MAGATCQRMDENHEGSNPRSVGKAARDGGEPRCVVAALRKNYLSGGPREQRVFLEACFQKALAVRSIEQLPRRTEVVR